MRKFWLHSWEKRIKSITKVAGQKEKLMWGWKYVKVVCGWSRQWENLTNEMNKGHFRTRMFYKQFSVVWSTICRFLPISSKIFVFWHNLFIQGYFGLGEGNRAHELGPSLQSCHDRDKGIDTNLQRIKQEFRAWERGEEMWDLSQPYLEFKIPGWGHSCWCLKVFIMTPYHS